MMLFMMDMHSILKFVSKYFQREEILIIEVEPFLQRAYIALENLRGGKGNKMLQFAETFPQSGKYSGVELNRARHQTRSKVQARMEQFAIQNRSDDIDISSCLFQSYNFYVDFIIAQLKDRFSAVTAEPISLFTIFNYQLWPVDQNSEAFSLFGDNEINKLVEQFKPLNSTEERVNIKMEWLSYKTFGLAKVKQFKADYKNVCGTDELQFSDVGDDDTDGCDSDDDEIANRLAPKKPGVMSAAQLCFDMFANREMLGITNICLLLNHMIVISPSNAHTERQIKFMNILKHFIAQALVRTNSIINSKLLATQKSGKILILSHLSIIM